jgi:hypothetical protein
VRVQLAGDGGHGQRIKVHCALLPGMETSIRRAA